MKLLHKFIQILVFTLCVHSSYGQLGFCTGNSGNPIFTETFGTGVGQNALPAGTTTYNYANGGEPNDGFYAVSNTSAYFDWFVIQDHTPNDTNGKMLVINSDFAAGQFYRTTITGLCANTSYEFSSWLINLSRSNGFCGAGVIPINVNFEIWDNTDTNLLASGSTGSIGSTSTPIWRQYGLVFQTLSSQTSVILKMKNNGNGGCGNDLAIDDIVFKSCGDAVVIGDSTGGTNLFEACVEDNISTVPLEATPDFSVFSTHAYQWQVSSDNTVWNDIAGETNSTYDAPAPTSVGSLYYRVKFAETPFNLQNSSCNSLSDSFEIRITPLVTPIFTPIGPICEGNTFTLPSTSNNTIAGTWSPALNNTTTTTYTFTPNPGECGAQQNLTVVITPRVTPTFNPVAPICNGDALTSLPTVSNNSVSGTWSPALDNTTTTAYTFTPDSNQCATTQTLVITVNQPSSAPTFAPIAAICSGDSVAPLPTVSTNGISGTWAPAINNMATTTYTFTPTTGSCAISTTLTIPVNQRVEPVFSIINSICEGDSIANLPTTSNNGITGTWFPALNTTTTTTYTFTPNSGECATTQSVTITVNPIIAPSFNAISPICSGGTFVLPAVSNNGISGNWSPAIDTTATTTYTFTPDIGECASIQTLTVVVNQPVTPTFSAVPPICSQDTFSLPTTSNNAIQGTWSPAINTAMTTTYTFTPNSNECATTQTMTVVINQATIPLFDPIPSICSGDMLSPLPTTSLNGINGAWSPALSNTATSTYTFTPNAGTCATNQTLTVVITPAIQPTFGLIAPICDGDMLNPLPTTSLNNISGTWMPALNNTVTTTYTFTPGLGQCATNQSLTIVVNPIITPTFDPIAPACSSDTIPALPTTSTNGVLGSWSPALDNTTTTTYTFTPASGQCATTQTLTIVVNQAATPTFDPVSSICSGDMVSPLPTTSNNNITGTWSPELNNTVTTTYTFTPDSGICANSVTLIILVDPLPSFDLEDSYALCMDTNGTQVIQSPVLTTNLSSSQYSFVWLNATGDIVSSNSFFEPQVSGAYSVVVTDLMTGCQNEDTTMVIDSSPPLLEVAMITESFTNSASIEVAAIGSGLYEYSLDGGPWQDSPIFNNIVPGEHVITARDKNGCGFSSIDICSIGSPKFFTPNGDTINDTWQIKGTSCLEYATIYVFDRYGKLLKEFDLNSTGWNGMFNGAMLPTNDYWFVINYKEIGSDVVKEYKGHFTLKR